MKRFYKDVSVAEENGSFRVLLDGRALKSPLGAALALPTRKLAEAVADEWRGQGEEIDLNAMPMTRLAGGAVDAVSANRGRIAEQALAFAKSDLLCYRAEGPAELVARQAASWDPLLAWAQHKYGARFAIVSGVVFAEQPADGLLALEQAVWALSDFQLAALHAAAGITGSLVLALALVAGRLNAAEAFAASQIDEAFQAEKWGEDAEAAARGRRLAGELATAERFLRSLDA